MQVIDKFTIENASYYKVFHRKYNFKNELHSRNEHKILYFNLNSDYENNCDD